MTRERCGGVDYCKLVNIFEDITSKSKQKLVLANIQLRALQVKLPAESDADEDAAAIDSMDFGSLT